MKKFLKILITLMLVISVTAAIVNASDNENKPVIIGFKDKPTQADKDQIHAQGGKIKYSYNIINAVAADLPDKAIEAFKKNPKVDYVEADGVVHALEQTVPWGINTVNAPLVHPYNKGNGVKVAIIDTGIDCLHLDLSTNCNVGYNFVSNNNNTADDAGHGTHVAGTVAAVDNTDGVIGVAPEADLYAVKVLDSTGSGYWSWVAAGIDWAATNNMQIVSMSLGGGASQTVENAVNSAYINHGVLLIAAAGNNGDQAGILDTVNYPAKYSNVIAVAATNNNNERALWPWAHAASSTGPKVELAAPGDNIYSTYPGGSYTTMSGTSMATPHVTGVAALVFNSDETTWFSKGHTNGDGTWTNREVREVLDYTATDLGADGRDTWYGFGLVNAYAAVPPASSIPPADIIPPAQVSGVAVTPASYNMLSISWTANTDTDLSYYNVYRSTSTGFSQSTTNKIASPTSPSFVDTGLASSTAYYYLVTAVDTSGNEGLASIETSGTTMAAPSMHISAIGMSKTKYGKFTYATAKVTVVDEAGSPVSGATVSGDWSGATIQTNSGVTDINGQATIQSRTVKNTAATFTFTVRTMVKSGWVYDASANDVISGTI